MQTSKTPPSQKSWLKTKSVLCDYIKSCGFDYAASVYRGNLKDHGLNALGVHNQEWVTKGALDFIEQNKDRPFFLHLCTTLQHSPAPNQSLQAIRASRLRGCCPNPCACKRRGPPSRSASKKPG